MRPDTENLIQLCDICCNELPDGRQDFMCPECRAMWTRWEKQASAEDQHIKPPEQDE